MSTPSEKSNLARIRENQRRSRARRREYVQELEQRLRLVEIQGIEASAEIQVVARKVAEENKKLRVLLNKNGITNDAIESFLASGLTQSPRSVGGGSVGPLAVLTSSSSSCCAVGGGSSSASSSRNNDVQELEALLIPRRPSWCDLPASVSVSAAVSDMMGGGEESSNSSMLVRSVAAARESLPLPLSPVESSSHSHASMGMYDGTNFSDHSSSRNSLPDESGFAQLSVSEHQHQQHQQRTLSPTISSMARSTPTEADHHHHHRHHQQHQQPRYYATAYSLSDNHHPTSPQEMAYSYGIEPLHSPYHGHHHTHPLAAHHHHQSISSVQSYSHSPNSRDDSLSSARSPILSSSHAHSHSHSHATANSCSMAANVISSMVGADPFQVRATLGCAPGVDCVVDNTTVSNAIDQLAASALHGGGGGGGGGSNNNTMYNK
ncbi:hypothetical protein V8F20_002544 [Naviculisporaceae sp. PSN 640]